MEGNVKSILCIIIGVILLLIPAGGLIGWGLDFGGLYLIIFEGFVKLLKAKNYK